MIYDGGNELLQHAAGEARKGIAWLAYAADRHNTCIVTEQRALATADLAGCRHADHDLVLAGNATDVERERRQQRHELADTPLRPDRFELRVDAPV